MLIRIFNHYILRLNPINCNCPKASHLNLRFHILNKLKINKLYRSETSVWQLVCAEVVLVQTGFRRIGHLEQLDQTQGLGLLTSCLSSAVHRLHCLHLQGGRLRAGHAMFIYILVSNVNKRNKSIQIRKCFCQSVF
jgi:hypothetical protein